LEQDLDRLTDPATEPNEGAGGRFAELRLAERDAEGHVDVQQTVHGPRG